ncbi:MAG: nucleotidyltransferase domain-containing protein [Candidatus Aenigmarchaeota archaeon]|nr:nucleotidyltransferase domain-containing protein [Candidatus Aenigmarchaeota archaeon]
MNAIGINKLVKKIRGDKDVLAIVLFGSAARDQLTPLSDVDICIVLKEDFKNKRAMFRKRIKYISHAPDKFDIQIFQSLPLYIKVIIFKEGEILYCRNKKELFRIALKTMKDYSLFKPHLMTYLEGVSNVM